MLGNFADFLFRMFKKFFFSNKLSEILFRGCHTVWIQIRPNIVGPDLGSNCMQRLSADDTYDTSRGKVSTFGPGMDVKSWQVLSSVDNLCLQFKPQGLEIMIFE